MILNQRARKSAYISGPRIGGDDPKEFWSLHDDI